MNNEQIFQTNFQIGNRTYFFDVKITKDGNKYLQISESKQINENDFERHQIVVFEEGFEGFINAMNQTKAIISNPEKAYALNEIRKKNPNAYRPWTIEEESCLEILFNEGKTIAELMVIFGRQEGGINSRLKKIELRKKEG